MRQVLLVSNPASRRGGAWHGAAIAAFRAAGVTCDAVITEAPGHGAEIVARLAPGYDAVFALGGDGTVMEVVGALSGTGLPTGVLPGGTGNLIARRLGIPLDVRAAVRALVAGGSRRMDLGRLGDGRRFAYSVGCGVDAAMVEETPATLKRALGMAGYVPAWTRAVLRSRRFAVRAVVDGRVIDREATSVMVCNQPAVMNGLMTFGPGISDRDGLLDLCVYSWGNAAEAARVLWRLTRADFSESAGLVFARGAHLEVETSPPQQVQADGELLGAVRVTADVEPLAGLFLTPAA
ncbi:MAG: hypothetical protein HYX65_13230 [Gemmatimonadetes bacterium]|nr:hypothetical protein [Gemmatimonadota bacterium]